METEIGVIQPQRMEGQAPPAASRSLQRGMGHVLCPRAPGEGMALPQLLISCWPGVGGLECQTHNECN